MAKWNSEQRATVAIARKAGAGEDANKAKVGPGQIPSDCCKGPEAPTPRAAPILPGLRREQAWDGLQAPEPLQMAGSFCGLQMIKSG